MARRWRLAAAVLEDPEDPELEWRAFEEAASVLFCDMPDAGPTPGWVPDEGVRPETGEEWRTLIDGLIAKKHRTRVAAAQWAGSRAKEYESRRAVEMEERAQLAALRALSDGTLDRAMNMTGRLRRDFIKLLEQYAARKGE